ncbi:hypothetical protein ACU686_10360 [Yinghuangia aomiensis]
MVLRTVPRPARVPPSRRTPPPPSRPAIPGPEATPGPRALPPPHRPPAGRQGAGRADEVHAQLREQLRRPGQRATGPAAGGQGADATVGFNVPPPSLDVPGSGNVLALVANEGADPTRDECSRAIGKNGTYTSGEMKAGTRYCLQTDEGHIAYLRVATVPTYTSVTFDVTVWE